MTYRDPVRVHPGTLPNQREMFFFVLGQLTADKGKGFIPVYRVFDEKSNVELQMCRHGEPAPDLWQMSLRESREGAMDYIPCKRQYFSVVLRGVEYFAPVFIGECSCCGRCYVLHDVQSLRVEFVDEYA